MKFQRNAEMTLRIYVPLTPAHLRRSPAPIAINWGWWRMSRRFAGCGLEVGVINLIQLQTGTDPGHRFYYHPAGIRSAVRDPPIFLRTKKRGVLEATTRLTLGSIIWISRSLVKHARQSITSV